MFENVDNIHTHITHIHTYRGLPILYTPHEPKASGEVKNNSVNLFVSAWNYLYLNNDNPKVKLLR